MSIASLLGAHGGKGEKSSSDKGSDVSIQPKDFFWDQAIKYLSSIMALLTVLDVTLQFFRGGGPICMVPGTIEGRDNVTLEVTRDQVAYINTLCQQSLSHAEYYPFFVLIQGVVLVAPHFIWEALFLGQFDFFFSIVQQLDRLRSRDTGKYRENNFEIVKKVEIQFDEKIIFHFYILKLIIQVAVVIASTIVNEAVFQNSYFSFTYECSVSINPPPQGWLLPFDVSCVYSSFRLYEQLKYINLSLLFFALVLIGYAICWCKTRHVEALGSKDVAQFAFLSGLRPTDYFEERFRSNPFEPNIKNDMDFLIMRLFRADPGHGYVFKDIQVEAELRNLTEADHESSQLITRSNNDHWLDDFITSDQENSYIAVDISFGSVGYSRCLTRKFDQVISINFDPFYANEKEPFHRAPFRGIDVVTLPEYFYAKEFIRT